MACTLLSLSDFVANKSDYRKLLTRGIILSVFLCEFSFMYVETQSFYEMERVPPHVYGISLFNAAMVPLVAHVALVTPLWVAMLCTGARFTCAAVLFKTTFLSQTPGEIMISQLITQFVVTAVILCMVEVRYTDSRAQLD